MRILKYKGKYDDEYWDVSTPEMETASYRRLFKLLDEDMKVYHYNEVNSDLLVSLQGDVDNCEKAIKGIPQPLVNTAKEELKRLKLELRRLKEDLNEKELYGKAKAGDVAAMLDLLLLRKSYEYEEWELIDVTNPLEE